jgi:hypothetical protein
MNEKYTGIATTTRLYIILAMTMTMAMPLAMDVAPAKAGELDRDKTGTTGDTKGNEAPQVLLCQSFVEPRSLETERAGFEPAVPRGYTAFPMPPDRPLRHLSGDYYTNSPAPYKPGGTGDGKFSHADWRKRAACATLAVDAAANGCGKWPISWGKTDFSP